MISGLPINVGARRARICASSAALGFTKPREAQLIRDVLLTLGLILSPASQLRPEGGSVGPGELCFALWLALAVIRNFGRLDLALTSAPLRILAFWLLFAVALSIGAMTAFLLGVRNDPALLMHDIKAYILVAGVSIFCVLEPMAETRLRRVAWLLATLGSAFLALQLAQALGLIAIARIDPWYWDRLRGWSENPNQLALVCIVIGFVAFHLGETSQGIGARLTALSCAVLAISAGLMTKSDSFLLVLAIGFSIIAALKLGIWIRLNQRQPGVRSALAWLIVLALPILSVVAAPASYLASDRLEGIKRDFVQNNRDRMEHDIPDRLALWKQAVDRGVESSMLGLGPGPHLVWIETASVDLGDIHAYERHWSEDPAPNFESHNTVLDLFTQGGLLAVVVFSWLCVSTFLMTARASLVSLATLLCALGVFSVFHFIMRHPLVWFVIALCLVSATSARRSPWPEVRGVIRRRPSAHALAWRNDGPDL